MNANGATETDAPVPTSGEWPLAGTHQWGVSGSAFAAASGVGLASCGFGSAPAWGSESSDGVTLSRIAPQTLTLIPGAYLFGTTWNPVFKFSVTPAGTVEYGEDLAFLSGAGTTVLGVHGFRIQVEATALTSELRVCDSTSDLGKTLSGGAVHVLALIPGLYRLISVDVPVFEFSVSGGDRES